METCFLLGDRRVYSTSVHCEAKLFMYNICGVCGKILKKT